MSSFFKSPPLRNKTSFVKSLKDFLLTLYLIHETTSFIIITALLITKSYLYLTDSDSDSEKTNFFNIGASYTKGATSLGLNYGRQRADLLCVGGVCRFVAEGKGLTANLAMSF